MTDTTTEPVIVRIVDRADGARIAKISINNPARLNCLNSAVMTAFVAAFQDLAQDRSIRAVVLTGEGDKAFIGGADITEMAALNADSGRAFITRVHACCAAVRDFPAPVIARIQGFALGAGLEVAAACDMRIAAEGAQLGMPEVKLGVPSVVEAALLPGLIGWGRTRQMLLLGSTIAAAEALSWGLVEQVASPETLDAAVEAWLDQICEAGPEALRLQKALIRRWEELPMSGAIQAGIDAFAQCWAGEEPGRMMGEFLERRRAAKAGS
ncbi:MAG TPA: enoyl-CoA hydratase [Caulobacteraceae bacterium]|jgi:enoyl-CoA hydratase/carnithine racemase